MHLVRKTPGGGGGSLPLEAKLGAQGKKMWEKSMFFRGKRGIIAGIKITEKGESQFIQIAMITCTWEAVA